MQLNTLTAISPLDGRYFGSTQTLAPYFSEYGLIYYRVRVEVEYFIALTYALPELSGLSKDTEVKLRALYETFSEADATTIKEIEKTTNHDVKAVEYFLKKKFDELQLSQYKEFIHFGLTSQDINNTAIPLSIKECMEVEFHPAIQKIVAELTHLSVEWKDIPMLARTHGQPASPTRLGKEMYVFVERLQKQLALLPTIPYSAKFGGATGNFNAHHIAYPDINWNHFANTFVSNQLGLVRSNPTTQIEHYDNLAALFDNLKRINTILIDNSRRAQLVERVQQACSGGRQAYWVCTLIEESDVLEAQAAEQTCRELTEALPDVRVGLVHGRLKADEKVAIMHAFKSHQLDLLVATTVIEVGVDVPNASLMIIENAERLGLAQLHQLRGRVGRGKTASHCALMYQSPLSLQGKQRLQAMRQSSDGFVIAEKDLQLRGPGELLGTRQTGLVQMRTADLVRDAELLEDVRTVAKQLIKEQRSLAEPLIRRWLVDAEQYAQV